MLRNQIANSMWLDNMYVVTMKGANVRWNSRRISRYTRLGMALPGLLHAC